MATAKRIKRSSVFNEQCEGIIKYLQKELTRIPPESLLHKHQIEAVFKAKDQLDNPEESDIAIVVLPTGCGKTGVAVLAPYVLDAARVLVITPSKTIQKQISEAFAGDFKEKREVFLVEMKVYTKDEESDIVPSMLDAKKTEEIPRSYNYHLVIITAYQVGDKSRVSVDDLPSEGYDLVIVDEAHHYPAPTWKKLVDHFSKSKRLFLTATPYHKGKYILPRNEPCYTLKRLDAVKGGIIRDIDFKEAPKDLTDEEKRNIDEVLASFTENIPDGETVTAMMGIAVKIMTLLKEHDDKDPNTFHQAMVLTQEKKDGGTNPAETFCRIYNSIVEHKYPSSEVTKNKCKSFFGGTHPSVVKNFKEGKMRTLVIVGKLLEGFDHKNVSVVGIARNVAKNSRVLFAQFLGRAVRKMSKDDPVTAVVVSHSHYKQKDNFDQFDMIPDDDVIIEE